jgi:hypothetical protein
MNMYCFRTSNIWMGKNICSIYEKWYYRFLDCSEKRGVTITFNLTKLTQYIPTPVLRLNLTFCFKYRCVRDSIYLLYIRHKVNKNVHWLLQARKYKDKTKMETSTSVDKTVDDLLFFLSKCNVVSNIIMTEMCPW